MQTAGSVKIITGGRFRIVAFRHPPDHPLQTRDPQPGQRQRDLIASYHIQRAPACNRADADTPDGFILCLHRLQVQHHRNFPGAANGKRNGTHFAADFGRLIFPCGGPASLSWLPVPAGSRRRSVDHHAIGGKRQRGAKPALAPRGNLFFIADRLAPLPGKIKAPARQLRKFFRHLRWAVRPRPDKQPGAFQQRTDLAPHHRAGHLRPRIGSAIARLLMIGHLQKQLSLQDDLRQRGLNPLRNSRNMRRFVAPLLTAHAIATADKRRQPAVTIEQRDGHAIDFRLDPERGFMLHPVSNRQPVAQLAHPGMRNRMWRATAGWQRGFMYRFVGYKAALPLLQPGKQTVIVIIADQRRPLLVVNVVPVTQLLLQARYLLLRPHRRPDRAQRFSPAFCIQQAET